MQEAGKYEGSTTAVATDTHEAVRKAFYAASLLTGNIALAEAAVMDGINELDVNQPTTENLRMLAIKNALRRSEHTSPHSNQMLSLLPPELQRAVLLPTFLRHCFVLRILLGLTSENCSKILQRSVSEIDEALCRGILMLAFDGRYSPETIGLQLTNRRGDDYVGRFS